MTAQHDAIVVWGRLRSSPTCNESPVRLTPLGTGRAFHIRHPQVKLCCQFPAFLAKIMPRGWTAAGHSYLGRQGGQPNTMRGQVADRQISATPAVLLHLVLHSVAKMLYW